EGVPRRLVRYACGDTWAHALEGFLSPLAGDALRQEIAALVTELLALPFEADARWFEASAHASAAQARSSVGLVHGLAHVLEPSLGTSQPEANWGHARLCSSFLWPVLCLDQTGSGKARDLAERYGLDLAQAMSRARALFDQSDYDGALPVLQSQWTSILRDPS